jgi:hypothetical protein
MDEVMDPRNPAGIRVGDVYEDCSFHPVLCTEIDDDGGVVLSGISLIDGSFLARATANTARPFAFRSRTSWPSSATGSPTSVCGRLS